MAEIFDPFSEPAPGGRGKRGRPAHVSTQQNRNKVIMLLALGWSNERIARALGITPPTLRKNYFLELRLRDEQRDRMVASLAMRFWEQVEAGNVAAMKEFRKIIEENDLMLSGQPATIPVPKEPKLGKKETALAAAQKPDTGSPLGELMARRQGLIN